MDIREMQDRSRDLVSRHPWEMARVEIISRKIRDILEKSGRSDVTLIDIGCGDVFVLNKLNNIFRFVESYGIDKEFNKDVISGLNLVLGHKIRLLNDINQLSLKKESFSIVLLMDVLEHIENDREFLVRLMDSGFVNDNTHFIVTVPAYQSLFCSHDRFLLHYRRYNNLQLVNLLQESGLKVKEYGYFYILLLLPRMMRVLAEKLMPQKNFSEGTALSYWNHSKLVTSIVMSILMMDYSVSLFFMKIGWRIPGLSNIAVCKKSA